MTVNNQDMYTSFEITAIPQAIGKTGDNGFCSDENNTIRKDPAGGHQLHRAPPIMRLAQFAFALVLIAPSLLAQDTAILRKVDDHYNHLTSLRTHYRETYAGMGMTRSEEGTLLLKKPGRMRWNYAQPAGKVFVLDGKFGWFYTPGRPAGSAHPSQETRRPTLSAPPPPGPYPARKRA